MPTTHLRLNFSLNKNSEELEKMIPEMAAVRFGFYGENYTVLSLNVFYVEEIAIDLLFFQTDSRFRCMICLFSPPYRSEYESAETGTTWNPKRWCYLTRKFIERPPVTKMTDREIFAFAGDKTFYPDQKMLAT